MRYFSRKGYSIATYDEEERVLELCPTALNEHDTRCISTLLIWINDCYNHMKKLVVIIPSDVAL